MTDWSPDRYLEFSEERARPSLDLIARVPMRRPRVVYDLGCGPGNSTAMLKQVYPSARIIGLDRSPAMIAKARESVPGPEFLSADVSLWQPDKEADLVFANALFQWVPHHAGIMQKIVAALKRDGVLAVQMPDNLLEPSHAIMPKVAEQGPWAAKLARAGDQRSIILQPAEYFDLLRSHCKRLEIWHTIYNHPVKGVDGIVALLKPTGLKPYLDPLSDTERAGFIESYKQALRKHYPAMADGTVLYRFPRLFILAQK